MRGWGRFMCTVLLCLFFFLFLLPLVFILTGSLMGKMEFLRTYGTSSLAFPAMVPRLAMLSQYITLLFNTPGYLLAYWNSLLMAVCICFFQLVTGVPCAYGFAKLRFRGRRVLMFLYVMMMMMPFQVTMLPMYQMIQRLGLFDSRWALIVPEIFAPFTVFLITQSIKLLPNELIEAMCLESTNPLTLYRHLVIPLCKPILIASSVLSFVETWNMVEKPLIYLNNMRNFPLSMLLYEAGNRASPSTLAGCLIYMIPILLVWTCWKEEICYGISQLEIK